MDKYWGVQLSDGHIPCSSIFTDKERAKKSFAYTQQRGNLVRVVVESEFNWKHCERKN